MSYLVSLAWALVSSCMGGGEGGKREGLIYMEKEEEAPSALLKVEKDKNKDKKE